MYYDTKAKQATKIGFKVEDGKKVRVAKKTGNVID
jgi:large subunit ribosomal protein L24